MKDPQNIPFLQRERQTYAKITGSPVGVLTLEKLEAVAQAVRKYNIPIIKLSPDQKIVLIGIREADIDDVKKDLRLLQDEKRTSTASACMA